MIKKVLATLLFFCMTLSLCVFTNAAVAGEIPSVYRYVLGDYNESGFVGTDDARAILRIAVGLEAVDAYVMRRCDINSDGVIDSADARSALRIAIGFDPLVKRCVKIYSYQLYIPSQGIDTGVYRGHCSQAECNSNDVVMTYDKMDLKNILFYGHNFNSLGVLPKLKVGDDIYFTANEHTERYKVTVSECGKLIDGDRDIQGMTTGTKLLTKCPEKALHMYTCYGFYDEYRWITIAEIVN